MVKRRRQALVSDTVGDGIPANVDGVLEQQFPSNLEDIIDADSRRRRLTWTQLSIARSSNGIPTERARLSVLRRQQEGQERLDEVYQLRQVEDLRGSIDNLQEPTDSEDEAESWGDEVREEDLHHFQEGNDDNSDGFAVSIPMRFHTFQAVKSRGRWHTGMSYAEEQKNELVEFEALRFKLLEAFLPFYMTDNKDKSYNELPKAVTCECDTCANSTQPPSRYSIPVLGSVGLETIRITACIGDISLPCLLLMNGIMPSSALKPAPGFSILKMVKAERDRRVLKKAFESIFASTFYDDFTINFGSKDPFYRNFLVAIRELLILRHMTWHGRLVKAVVDKLGPGRTKCPCEGGKESKGLLFRTADAYFSAKKLSREHGGGGDYGTSIISKEFFKNADSSYLSTVTNASVKEQCSASFIAGSISSKASTKTDVSAIFATFCRHEASDIIYDIDKGEKLTYAVNSLMETRKRFQNRQIAFFYDIACKLHPHLVKHGQPVPYITMVPKLHAYCHDKGCQAGYGPHICMGIGTADLEGSERRWSDMAPVIGSTQRQTAGNRHLSISVAMNETDISRIERIPIRTLTVFRNGFKKLASLDKIGVQAEIHFSQSGYMDAVKRNRETRKQVFTVFKNKDNVNKSKYLLRLKLDQEASQIRNIERTLLRRRSGTTITSKLKRKLKKHQENFNHYLNTYNNFDANSSEINEEIARLDLLVEQDSDDSDHEMAVFEYNYAATPATPATITASKANITNSPTLSSTSNLPAKLTEKDIYDSLANLVDVDNVQEYWRILEDFALHTKDLENMLEFYHEKQQEWDWIEGEVEKEYLPRTESLLTARKLIRKAKLYDEHLANAIAQVLDEFNSFEYGFYKKSHLEEVRENILINLGSQNIF